MNRGEVFLWTFSRKDADTVSRLLRKALDEAPFARSLLMVVDADSGGPESLIASHLSREDLDRQVDRVREESACAFMLSGEPS